MYVILKKQTPKRGYITTSKLIQLLYSLGKTPAPLPAEKFTPQDIVSAKLLLRITLENDLFLTSNPNIQEKILDKLIEKHKSLKTWLARFEDNDKGAAALIARINIIWALSSSRRCIK